MNNESAQAKLADLERQVKELKEQLAPPGHWVPKVGERYLSINAFGDILPCTNDDCDLDEIRFKFGNTYPVTTEGRAAAEHAAFLLGFRARWRRSADMLPGSLRWMPAGSWRWMPVKFSKLTYNQYNNADGLPGWSTEEKCRAFVDSEGGPERFAEILARGIL